MMKESQMRQDIRNACSKILFEDERYLIGIDKHQIDEHSLLVNDAYGFLIRGILNELARSDSSKLVSTLEILGNEVLEEMRSKKIPFDELGWALAKAAIKDQEDYASFLSQRAP